MKEIQHEKNKWLVLETNPCHVTEMREGMVTAMPDNMQYKVFGSYEEAKAFILTLDPDWVDPQDEGSIND